MPTRTRRDFLVQTGALAGAVTGTSLIADGASKALAQSALAQSSSATNASRPPSPARKLGWAICGLGSLSENQIAPALLKTQYSRLAGVITDTPEKARRWTEKYGLTDRDVLTYSTMQRLAEHPGIDVVYIVTPNALHAQQAAIALRAGKHVFCEKPMEVSVAKCQQMIDDAKSADRRLAVAYRCQFDPNHLECVRLARSRELGEVRLIESTFAVDIGDPGQWRLKHALSGGGALVDVGIYALQAARYISGEEPVEVRAMETKTNATQYAEVDETMLWTMRFPSGVVASCSCSYGMGTASRIRVHTDRGWFGLEPAFYYTGNRGERSDGKPIALPAPDLFAAEMDDFSRCILEQRESKVSGREGLQDVKIMAAIYEAARTGRAVRL